MVDYDYIVRTETHSDDAPYIIMHKLASRGLTTKDKSWRDAVLGIVPQYGRELKEFTNISDDLLAKIGKLYAKDFDMYGYGYFRNNGSVITKCELEMRDGEVCC